MTRILYPTIKEVDEANEEQLKHWQATLPMPDAALERVLHTRICMRLKGEYVP